MHITSRIVGSPLIAVVSIHGYVDHGQAATLALELALHIAQGQHKIVIDLEETDLLCSAAYGIVIQAMNQCRSLKGDVRLAAPCPHIEHVLKVLRLNEIITVCSTVDAGIKSFAV